MSGGSPLYIYLHIGKCGGTTFFYHLRRNLGRDEIFYATTLDPFFSAKTGRYENFRENFIVRERLASLTPAAKARLRVVHGHDVEPGLAAQFDRPVRFVTFLREPSERLLSHYRYHAHRFAAGRMAPDMASLLLSADGGFPGLDQYVERMPDNYMVRFVCQRFLGREVGPRAGPEHLETAKRELDRFYFVGVTENLDEQALYLYRELGIRRFYPRQNVSRKFEPAVDGRVGDWLRVRERVREKNALDEALYAHAFSLAEAFKNKTPDYARVVAEMKTRRRFWLPLCYATDVACHPLASAERGLRKLGRLLRAQL